MPRDAVFAKIMIEKGQVVVAFSLTPEFTEPHAIDHWILDPAECLAIAEAMATEAFEARDGLKPAGPALKAELVERHRMTLTQRCAHVLRGLRDDKTKSDGQVAQQLVEIMLKEVF